MSERFRDAMVLVGGGTGALGRVVIQGFLREGAQVVTTYRSASKLEELKVALGSASARLRGCLADLSDEANTREQLMRTGATGGRFDILINTVGGYEGGKPAWQTELAALDRLLAMNVRALHCLLRAVVPLMLERRQGCIVNVAAKAAVAHPPHAAAYAASKAAALAMMGSLAAELTGTDVRANSILPSTIDTEANRRAMPKADTSRWVSPQQIGDVILFLCSPEGQAVRGAEIEL